MLSSGEVGAILEAARSPKYRAAFMLCYGSGLRTDEVVRLQPRHIDSQRMVIPMERGKGKEDRQVMLSERLLEELRSCWRRYAPKSYLLEGKHGGQPIDATSIQRAFRTARELAGVKKRVTPRPAAPASCAGTLPSAIAAGRDTTPTTHAATGTARAAAAWTRDCGRGRAQALVAGVVLPCRLHPTRVAAPVLRSPGPGPGPGRSLRRCLRVDPGDDGRAWLAARRAGRAPYLESTLGRPHLHCLVTGGGLGPHGFVHRRRFLVPLKALRPIFKGKLLSKLQALLREGTLSVARDSAHELLRDASRREWKIDIRRPLGGPEQVVNYFARYTSSSGKL